MYKKKPLPVSSWQLQSGNKKLKKIQKLYDFFALKTNIFFLLPNVFKIETNYGSIAAKYNK